MQDNYNRLPLGECDHHRWQYCRRTTPAGAQFFGAQCLDCLTIIKLDRHGGKLALKPADIPANAPIHAWIDPDLTTGQGGLDV